MSDTLTAAQRVAIARHPQRPNINDYIQALFTDFFEQKGDRLCGHRHPEGEGPGGKPEV